MDAASSHPRAANATTDDVVITMLGTLGLQVASRFARSLRETGAACRLVLLLPRSSYGLTAGPWGCHGLRVVFSRHARRHSDATKVQSRRPNVANA